MAAGTIQTIKSDTDFFIWSLQTGSDAWKQYATSSDPGDTNKGPPAQAQLFLRRQLSNVYPQGPQQNLIYIL